ncbi:MAG: DEAD/DEAH box helicase family protein [Bacteroidota bacterium]
MELKPYQQQVLNDISLFLDHIQESRDIDRAFTNFWKTHPKTPLEPVSGQSIEPYKNNIPRVPHVCVKVPTAGGKTFIACNAIKTIFDAFAIDQIKTVVWLVPSITILDQTLKNLKDPSHPYRQKINTHFGNKVEVFEKTALLQGTGFNATSVQEQLSIIVLSFDSLRSKNKEDKKVFRENGNLQSFGYLLDNEPEISLSAVIAHLNPLVIVDESHNAESELSVEMLRILNPCFILDLTATPRANSNIISFIDALELKKENMVKLPVIVRNHIDRTEVIHSSLQLQKQLEIQAIEEEKNGGKYIRPIVLFQAQPRNGKSFANAEEEKSNVQRLKEKLLELGIPEEQIRIKTANINEIKGVDLMSPDCEVRFIITINALKEGWDCPFAYILASLADKSSAVDVEQILGRVLRQPYVMKHSFPMLNFSYVFTASHKFIDTLDNIVKGLNRAGFSDKTSRKSEAEYATGNVIALNNPGPEPIDFTTSSEDEIEVGKLKSWGSINRVSDSGTVITSNFFSDIEHTAVEQNRYMEARLSEMDANNTRPIPGELQQLVKSYPIKDVFKTQAAALSIEQFYIKVNGNDLFGGKELKILEKEDLLEGFPLGKCDTNIVFDAVSDELYKIDLDETRNEHTPTFIRLDGTARERILSYILDPVRREHRVRDLTRYLMRLIGVMAPIPDKELERYISRILEDFTDQQFNDLAANEYTYKDKIKSKINALLEAFAEKTFRDFLDTDRVISKPSYLFPIGITPGETAKDITKSLYEREGSMNGFEERVINEIGNMPNILFWTRNLERKGFRINGFLNHYPDFIIQTKSGKTVLLETKGDHLDAEQKIRLGAHWANKAGNNFRYFMVYERRLVDGAYRLEDFLKVIKEI